MSAEPEACEVAELDYALQEATLWRDRLIEASDDAKKAYHDRIGVPYHPSHLVGPPLDAPPRRPSVVTTTSAPPTLRLPDSPLSSGSTTSRGKRSGVQVRAREAVATSSGPRFVGPSTTPRPSGPSTTPRPSGSSTGTRPSGSSIAPRLPAPRPPAPRPSAPRPTTAHGHAPGYGYPSSPGWYHPGYPSSAAPHPGYGYGYPPASAPPPPLRARMEPLQYAEVAGRPRLEEINDDDEDEGVAGQGSGGRGGERG